MKISRRIMGFILVLGMLLQMFPVYAENMEDTKVIMEDDCSDLAAFGYVNGTGINPENVSITQQRAAYHFTTKTKGTEGFLSKNKKGLGYAGGPAEIAMQVKVNDLPVITANPTYRGFGAELRAYNTGETSSEYIKVMLSATTEGAISFNIVNSNGGGTGVVVTSAYKLADKPLLDIKLTKDSNNLLMLTVNGAILAENINASNAKVPNTNKTPYFEMFNGYYQADKSYGAIDVELYAIDVRSGTTTLLSDDCTNLAGWGNGAAITPENVPIIQQEQQNYYKFQTVNKGSQGILTKRFDSPVGYEGGAATLTMQVKVNDLPVITANPTYRGFGAELCAYTDGAATAAVAEYIKVMLSASTDGYILFNIVNGSLGDTGVSVKSSYKLEDKPVLDIKLEKSAAGFLTLTVNGEVLKTDVSASAAKKKNASGKGKAFVELFNCYYNFDAAHGVVDVELHSIEAAAPGSGGPVEPEPGRRTDLNAYMAEKAPIQDGILTDAGYNLLGNMTETNGSGAPTKAVTAVQWDGDYLYFGVKYTGSATKYEATVNGKTVVYDIAGDSFGSVTGAVGKAAPGIIEMKIPYSAFSIDTIDYNQIFENICFKLSNATGSAAMKGSLKLLGAGFIWEEDFDSYALNGYKNTNLGGDNAAKALDVTQQYDGNGNGYIKVNTKDYSVENVMMGLQHPIPAYDNGYFTIDFNARFDDLPMVAKNQGWRGFSMEVRTTTVNNRFNFTRDETDRVMIDMLGADQLDTGLTVSDGMTHNIKIVGDKETMAVSVYVDGRLAGKFAKKLSTYIQNTTGSDLPRIELQFLNYDRPSATSEGGGCCLEISDFTVYRPDYINPEVLIDTLLKDITWNTIKGGNVTNEMIVSDINVSNAAHVTLPFIGTELPIIWSSSNPEVISDTGELLYTGADNIWVTLTASVSYLGETMTKEFKVQIPGHIENGNVSMLRDDLNPYRGTFDNWTVNTGVALDKDKVSIGYDLGSAQRINRVLLMDDDTASRIKEENISLYVSNDNVTYTKVNGWSFIKLGSSYCLYNFDVEARYVKVHSHFDNLDPFVEPSFRNNLKNIISVYYSDEVIGANGGVFAKSKNIRLTNTGDDKLEDYVAYIPLEKVAISAECKSDMSDVRFVSNGKTLYHYFDGKGFYIRIPSVTGKGAIDITMLYSNANAEDISTGEGTFEAVYGRINLFKTAVDNVSSGFAGEHKVRTMPNGDVIAIGSYTFYKGMANQYDALVLKRSTDGGRTWEEPVQISDSVTPGYLSGGGFAVDKVTGRVFYFGFHYIKFSANDMKSSDCKMYYIYSDDNSYTWSDVNYIANPQRPYFLSYTNAIMTSVYDGEGPNVDFVLTYGFQADNTGSFAVSSIYSDDAGKTWQITESDIRLKAEGVEGGVSESALVELEDGTLYTVMRAQAESNDYYYASYSYDYGKTWDETPTPTNILTTNTMPVLDRYDGNLLLLWQGNNTMGGKSYKRFPLNVSYSADDGVTWEKILDLSLGTSLQIPAEIRLTQSDITFADYRGERDAVIVWNNMEGLVGSLGDTATAMQVENFEEYLYKTQGAFDSFEGTNARNEGWVQLVVPPFSFDISSEQAAEGSQSMKFAGKGSNTMVSRNIPSMKNGTIAYSVYLPEDFSTTLYTEFKAAYNTTLNKNAVVSFYINAAGELCSKMVGKPAKVHTTLAKGEWHNIEVVFDIATKTSIVYVDGEACGSLAINPGAQIATVALTLASESSVYIDNFRAAAANKYTNLMDYEITGEPETYTVTFIVDNETYHKQTATTGGAIALPSSPTKDGYTFKGWYTAVSGGTEATEFTSTMTVYAQWTQNSSGGNPSPVINYYTITATAGEGGKISPQTSSVAEYSSKIFTITPDEGYEVAAVTVDGKSVGTVTTYTFSNVTGNHTIGVTFQKVKTPEEPKEPETPEVKNPFADVNGNQWFYDSVMYVYQHGLMSGVSTDKFNPLEKGSRGMLATILHTLADKPEAAVNGFKDVKEGQWYTDAIAWAAENKIVSGYGNGNFGPNDNITREQMAVIFYNYAKYQGYDLAETSSLEEFTDNVRVSGWANEAMQWMVGSGMMSGKGNHTLDPKGTATRAEMASIMQKFAEKYRK